MNDPVYQEIDEHTQRLELEQRLGALDDFEATLVKQAAVPDARKLLVRRIAFLLHVLGAGAIGLVLAMLTVLINFIVFTKILHL